MDDFDRGWGGDGDAPRRLVPRQVEARGTAARHNAGKPPYGQIPLCALESGLRVFAYGAKKYEQWNWAKGMRWSVPYECMLRHLDAWYRGEDLDPESGLTHLGHVMCNLVMLEIYAKTHRAGDVIHPH